MKGMHFSFIFTLPLCCYVDFNLLFFYNLQFLFRYASVTNSQGVAVYTVKGTLSHLEDDLKKSINLLKSSTSRHELKEYTEMWMNVRTLFSFHRYAYNFNFKL